MQFIPFKEGFVPFSVEKVKNLWKNVDVKYVNKDIDADAAKDGGGSFTDEYSESFGVFVLRPGLRILLN